MTIKDLYDMAKAIGIENATLTLDYQCNDDWYSYCNDINQDDIVFLDNEICISIENEN